MQLWIFLKQIATGDFGVSWATNENVSQIFATRLGPSLTVLVPMLVIGTLLAMAAAMLVAYLRGSLTDRAIMIACTVGQSISILVYIIVLQYLLGYQLGWFPVQGWGRTLARTCCATARCRSSSAWSSRSRPTSGSTAASSSTRSTRTTCAPRARKGWAKARVMWLHVLRNAAIPIVTNVMMQLPGLLAGAFLIERFFSIPGIGREVILAVERSDFPVIKAVTVYVAIATMVVNLAADLLYRALDPRVQLK